MNNKGVVAEKLDISNTDDFGAAVLPLGYSSLLARPYCKEECKDRQLCDR